MKSIVVFLFPVLVLAGWWVSLALEQQNGTIVRLPITGYDPRDLLSGHYLRYNVGYGDFNPCAAVPAPGGMGSQPSPRSVEQCVCLRADDAGHQPYYGGECTDAPSDCTLPIRGTCYGSQFSAGIERYYIPEHLAPALQTVPRDATIELSVSSRGRALTRSIFVAGLPIEEFAAQKLSSTR